MEQTKGYLKVLKIMLRKWYYLLVSLLCSVLCAYVFLYFTMPCYTSNASVKLDDRKTELAELINIKNIYDRTSKAASEKMILCSRKVLTKAIEALDYKIAFYADQNFQLVNIYPQKPLSVELINLPAIRTHKGMFKFETHNRQQFRLTYTLKNTETTSLHSYGKRITIDGVIFKINRNSDPTLVKGPVHFKFNEIDQLVANANAALTIDDNQQTNILNLTLTDPNPYYASDLLNSILQEYQNFDRLQRSVSIKQTSHYIDTLLKNMAVDLQRSAADIQQFKSSHQMLDISSNAESLMVQLTGIETEKHNLKIQDVLIAELKKAIESNHGDETPNFNLQGVEDLQLIALLNKFNQLVDKKTASTKTYQPSAVFMVHLNGELEGMKQAITDNIKNQQLRNRELLTYLNRQTQVIKSRITAVPAKEKDFISLQSDYNVNQKVYNYLSEKKLEAHISTAAVTSGAQVIDEAIVAFKPSYPIEANIYKDFAIAGFLLGTLSIFVVRKLDPYLYDVETIAELCTVPIIGYIRKQHGTIDQHQILSIDCPRSLFSESIRALRANLNFMISGNSGQVICITSEIAAEGKSFTSLNLAGTLCLMDKKVIIVATDLRKSQLHHTFETSNLWGLSSYLSGQEAIENLCLTTRFNNLDFIPAGPIPPNPSELIQSAKMTALISFLRVRYDFIILDSAPVGLVSDSIPLMRMADINFFVLRYGFSRREAAALPDKLAKEFKLSNMAVVLNGFDNVSSPKSYYSLTSNERSYEHYDSANVF